MKLHKLTPLVILVSLVLLVCCGSRADEEPIDLFDGTHKPESGVGTSGGAHTDESSGFMATPAAVGGRELVAEEAKSAEPALGRDGEAETVAALSLSESQQQTSLRAGEVDDNHQWDDYLLYRREYGRSDVRNLDVSERYAITVVDSAGRTVHNALVSISSSGREPIFEAVTDAGGRVLFHPRAYPAAEGAESFAVQAWDPADPSVKAAVEFPREPALTWELSLSGEQVRTSVRLDLLFLLDATGSMGDEIDALKSTILEISAQIDALPEKPEVSYGLVTYRDRGDVYVTRVYDFTPNVTDFQHTLAAVTANGGDDYPESLNEALHDALHRVSWRESKTVRLIFLVADAPPHLDYPQDYDYAEEVLIAADRGIKVFPIASSGLDDQGEYIFRQIAQVTGGKFIFLTYAADGSGPGEETEHHVEDYTVQNLDALVVRLVEDELAKLSR